MGKNNKTGQKDVTFGNSLLLLSVFFAIFVIPIFPVHLHYQLYYVIYIIIFITSVLSLESHRRKLLIIAIVNILSIMLAALLNLSYLEKASSALHVIFFFYIVFRLIMQIAGKKEVDRLIILESVNGYLLIGLLFSVVINEIYAIDNTTFSYSQSDPDQSGTTPNLNIFIYFTLVTMTTLGYGDIVPVKPLTKSLATIIAVVGQFYIAVIVAMLVGKYVSKN